MCSSEQQVEIIISQTINNYAKKTDHRQVEIRKACSVNTINWRQANKG